MGQPPWKDQEGVCVIWAADHKPDLHLNSLTVSAAFRMMFMSQMRTCSSCYSVEVSLVPWQSDRAEISQCVIHQLQTLHPDQSPQDTDEVLQLVPISQVLIRQVQHLGSQRQNCKRDTKMDGWMDRYIDRLFGVSPHSSPSSPGVSPPISVLHLPSSSSFLLWEICLLF